MRKRSIFLLFIFSLLFLFWISYRKRKQKREIRIFAIFAWKCPFLSQIIRCFSVLYRYIGQITPHPTPFWHSNDGAALLRKFFIFLFFIFVKYSDFANSAFLLNFEHFRKYHIYFFFCIKFHSIYFWLFLCVRWRFMQLCGIVYPEYFERLRTQLSSFLYQFSFLRKSKSIFEFKTRFCYLKIAVSLDYR